MIFLALLTHVVVINITIGIAEMRTVLFSPFPILRGQIMFSYIRPTTTLAPCQFHKLLFCVQGLCQALGYTDWGPHVPAGYTVS